MYIMTFEKEETTRIIWKDDLKTAIQVKEKTFIKETMYEALYQKLEMQEHSEKRQGSLGSKQLREDHGREDDS